ncbi:hypothetical protein OU994_08015 [Pseudoduganella sp. SL102]|nr:hypothetical protein OU994_08015 [Pseudoduganella sp. SL102]
MTLSQQYLHLTPRSFAYQQTESHQIWLDRAVDDARDGTSSSMRGRRRFRRRWNRCCGSGVGFARILLS